MAVDKLDSKDYGPEKIRGCRYVLVVIDSFSKFGWTIPLKYKNAQTITDFFEKNSQKFDEITKLD